MVRWLFDQVTWDGQALLVPATTDPGQVVCTVPRNTIHMLRLYSDAIGREIHLERQRIAEKLAPFLAAKLSQAPNVEAVELFPWEVRD
ncbi:hypothetical protein V1290_006090 [Bradyrhizobium sp. AZCC 1578]|uniref:hypothetical protein n=1 Tax=Bradyrhizobium sp. AZCC 1578 TaxID=3117027 RepID=UPI002FEFDD5D